MRILLRVTSIVLLLALVAPLAAVCLPSSASQDPNLPACCRRDGKHHCAMMAGAMASSNEIQLKSSPEPCPFRGSAGYPAHSSSAFIPAAQVYFAALVSHPAIHAQTTAIMRVSALRSHQKRGPPSLA